jgi:predicted enzyme related to lactoylglutathione lyase
MASQANPIVHLELRTGNLPRACSFYAQLFGWRAESVRVDQSSYLTLDFGDRVNGGVAELEAERPLWLPYVKVDCVDSATERARDLGAAVLLEPREGPVGWRSVVESPDGGEIALWRSKA